MRAGGRQLIRLVPVGLAACAIAALIVQNAAVAAFSDPDPATAARIWPGHPAAAAALASRDIAEASGSGKPIRTRSFDLLEKVARSAPLDPKPFLVAGIRAQIAGRADEADRAFQAARLRDPRSLPARYFLATSRLQRGNPEGLRDVAALARLAPNGSHNLTPFIAAFASQPRAAGAMREMFRENREIRDAVLTTLAGDSSNLPLVMRLGGTLDPREAPWLETMIRSLIADRRYADARALWERTSRTRLAGIFDPGFRNGSALPPFNWDLTESPIGVAERRSGRLEVIFYGQESGTLARQLLLLPAGQYRVAAPISAADRSGILYWLIRCDNGAGEIARAPAEQAGLTFTVPAGCAAQWLELNGRASDFGRQAEAMVGPMSLTRIGGR